MSELTAAKPEVKVVMDQIGTPTSAADLAFLIYNIIEEGKLDKTGIYNYSDEGVCSWYDFAKEINDQLGYTCDVKPCRTAEYPTKAVRPSYSVLDKKKVKETFGVQIPHWRESLALIVQDYLHSANL
jgi:dTDP-4-dehydrorhamnose reductase